MWILLPNIDLHCFVARQFLSRIYALLSVKFPGLKMCECKKMTNIKYAHCLTPLCLCIVHQETIALSFLSQVFLFLWYARLRFFALVIDVLIKSEKICTATSNASDSVHYKYFSAQKKILFTQLIFINLLEHLWHVQVVKVRTSLQPLYQFKLG